MPGARMEMARLSLSNGEIIRRPLESLDSIRQSCHFGAHG